MQTVSRAVRRRIEDEVHAPTCRLVRYLRPSHPPHDPFEIACSSVEEEGLHRWNRGTSPSYVRLSLN